MLIITNNLYIFVENIKINTMALRKNEYYTEVNGQITVVEKIDPESIRDRRYKYFDFFKGNPIMVIRLSIEVFKRKSDAKKYFNEYDPVK